MLVKATVIKNANNQCKLGEVYGCVGHEQLCFNCTYYIEPVKEEVVIEISDAELIKLDRRLKCIV